MKWLSILYLGTIAIYAQAQPLNSSIKEVTVYNDRAAVTRYAEVELGQGEYDLTFENLPVGLDERSLQVAVKAGAPVTLLDISSRLNYITNDEQINKNTQQIKALNTELLKIANQLVVVGNQSTFTEQIRNSILSTNEKANRPSVQEAKEVVVFFASTQEQLTIEQRQLEDKKQKLMQELTILQHQVNKDRYQEVIRTKHVTVNVRSPKAEKIKLTLTYIVPDAGWYPTYDARFDSKNQKLSLSYLGNVFQETGEDWSNVSLTLSTAQPTLSGSVPILLTWVLRPYIAMTESTTYAAKDNMAGARMLVSQAPQVLMREKKQEAKKPRARVEQSLTSASFIIEQPTSLVSSEDTQKVSINTLDDLQTDLIYQVIPRLMPRAFLEAKAKNNTAYPLLAGELNVFIDGRFVAKNKLNTTMPDEKFNISLGGDDSIKVTYKEVNRFVEKTGFTNSGERITYDYLITLKNNSTKVANVNIKDQIPVSQNEKIKVKLLSSDKIKANKEGVLDWLVAIKPAEELAIPVKFSVDYPVKTDVIGL